MRMTSRTLRAAISRARWRPRASRPSPRPSSRICSFYEYMEMRRRPALAGIAAIIESVDEKARLVVLLDIMGRKVRTRVGRAQVSRDL